MITVEIFSHFATEAGVRTYNNMADAVADTARIACFEPNQTEKFAATGYARATFTSAQIIPTTIKTFRGDDITAALDAIDALAAE